MHIIADFKIQRKAELYEKLDAAVAAARADEYSDKRHGLLVTRHDFGHFSVAFSPNVPLGLILEDDQARRI